MAPAAATRLPGTIPFPSLSLLFLLAVVALPLVLADKPLKLTIGMMDGSEELPEIPMGLRDGVSLLILYECLGRPEALLMWKGGGFPCDKKQPWIGVVCTEGAVTGIHLGGMGISSTLNETHVRTLRHVRDLRNIDLSRNHLSGDIPPLGDLVDLESIVLSNNQFSGTIDDDLFANMRQLKEVWLSGNSFTGYIPSSLSKLSHLTELHLENNQFSGSIPDLNIQTLKSFNVSNNRLEGDIPAGVAKFDAGSFEGNPGVCLPNQDKAKCQAYSNGNEVQPGRVVLLGIVLGMLLLPLVAGVPV